MSSIFTKLSLIFYTLLTLCFYPYFSIYSLCFFGAIAGTIIIYKRTKIRILTYLRFPFLLLSIFIIYNEYGTWRGFEPASILFSTLVLLKIFELKSKRDIYSLILIQFLQVLSLSLLVEDFYYLFIIFISLLICFCNLYLVQQFTIEKSLLKKSLKSISKYSAYGAPIVIILFLAFPRFNFGGFLLSTNTASTGFSEDLKPGDIAEIIKDPTVVFHASFTKKTKRFDLYWRGQILAENDHFDWNKTKLPEKRNYRPVYKKYDYLVSHDTLSTGHLFTLEGTRKVALSSFGSLINLKGNLFLSTSIRNQKPRYKGWLGEDLPVKLLKGYEDVYLQTKLPKKTKLLNYIEDNKSLMGKPEEVALHLKSFFRKDFSYSTSPGVYDGDNALDEFLFKRRVGFCGHFASASATLFRLFGIPARIIVGYQGGFYNDLGDFYIIAKKDAHTWVEYLASDGIWTRFDAVSVVSPERILYGADAYFEFEKLRNRSRNIEEFISNRSGVMSEWRQFIQNIYYKSGTLFFNYDLEAQKNLFRGILKYNYSKSTIVFYLPYMFFAGLVFLFLYFRKRFQALAVFLCINKYYSLSWSKYRTLSETQLIEIIAEESSNSVRLIMMYQSLSYSRDESVFKQLSFFYLAFKILVYG